MTFSRKLILPIASLALAAASASAFAAEPWAATATKAPRLATTTSSAVAHVATMQAGSPTHIAVTLQLRNKPELDALTNNLLHGGGAHPISSAEFLTRFAPTAAQAQAVVDHLRQSGFINVSVSANRMVISADGTAAAIKSGFNTELNQYSVHGRMAHANVTPAQVPLSLGNTVLAVHGLQTIHTHHVMAKPMTTTLSSTGHSPSEFSSIYNASGLPSATNAVIGIITQGSMTQTVTDLRQFAASAGYPAVNVQTVTVGAASTDVAGIGEWNMDTQDALAAAGGTISKMLLYTATTLSDADLTMTYNKVVSDNLAKTVNVSLGECENDAKASGIMASNDQIFQTAVAQGQTFSVSSGDSGAGATGSMATRASCRMMHCMIRPASPPRSRPGPSSTIAPPSPATPTPSRRSAC